MAYKTNTNVLPIVGVGTYDTILSPYAMFNADFQDYDGEGAAYKDEDWDKFSNAEYMRWLGKVAAQVVSEVADERLVGEKYGIKAVTSDGHITSPRYYNFATDELDIDIEVMDGFADIALANLARWEKEDGAVKQWVKDNYTSYDGFMSFVPNTIGGIADKIRDGKDMDRIVGVYCALCLVDGGYFKESIYSDESPYDDANREIYEGVAEKSFGEFLIEDVA